MNSELWEEKSPLFLPLWDKGNVILLKESDIVYLG